MRFFSFLMIVGVTMLFTSCFEDASNLLGGGENTELCECMEATLKINTSLEKVDRDDPEHNKLKAQMRKQEEECEKVGEAYEAKLGDLSDEAKGAKVMMEVIQCPFYKEYIEANLKQIEGIEMEQ